MIRSSCFALLVATVLALPVHATDNPCGGVEFHPVECHFEFGTACKSNCVPLAFVAACDGQCNLPPDDGCVDSCEETCLADCDGGPPIDCFSRCTDDCEASLDDPCGGGCDPEGESCSEDCATHCAGAGTGCASACTAACSAVCENVANRECTGDCRAELSPTCENACDAQDGALFCDGQLIGTLLPEACLDFLGVEPPKTLPGEEEGCSVAHTSGSGLAAGLALAAAAFRARRRRR